MGIPLQAGKESNPTDQRDNHVHASLNPSVHILGNFTAAEGCFNLKFEMKDPASWSALDRTAIAHLLAPYSTGASRRPSATQKLLNP